MAVNIKHLGYLSYRNHGKPVSYTKNHIKYIGKDTKEHQNKVFLFDEKGKANRKEFFQKIERLPKRGVVSHKLVFSLSEDERDRRGIDMIELAREVMKDYQDQNLKQGKFDWIASFHDDEGHPHVHVVLLGRTDIGKEVGIRKKNLEDFRKISERVRDRLTKDKTKDRERDWLKELDYERELYPVQEPEKQISRDQERSR